MPSDDAIGVVCSRSSVPSTARNTDSDSVSPMPSLTRHSARSNPLGTSADSACASWWRTGRKRSATRVQPRPVSPSITVALEYTSSNGAPVISKARRWRS